MATRASTALALGCILVVLLAAASHVPGSAAITLDAAGSQEGAEVLPVSAAELRGFMLSMTASHAELRAVFENHSGVLAELAESSVTTTAVLAELAESSVTTTVAARVEACARVTSGVAVVVLNGGGYRLCSAVPRPSRSTDAAAESSTHFLSAAHCFINDATGLQDGRNVTIIFGGAAHKCALLAHFGAPSADPLDLALIGCAHPVPVAPTRLSATPYAPHTRAVLLGHSEGSHVDAGKVVNVTTAMSRLYVPHVRFTRLVASFQSPLRAAAADSAGGAVAFATRGGFAEEDFSFSPLPLAAAAAAKGFVDVSPSPGMSGGAVVDTRCGLFGITERKSTFAQGGQFVLLTPAVLARIDAVLDAQ
jgi:hypothetical protein